MIQPKQIKGLKELFADILVLKNSYDANKVLTSISKGETLPNYNVNEMLIYLKSITDTMIDSEDYSKILTSIEAIENKQIKDRLKVVGRFENSTITMPAVPGEVIKTDRYNAYYINNSPILNELGENITYDFITNTFNGIPSILDPKSRKKKIYIPITEAIDFKVFPIGAYKFKDLTPDYLLDNEELNLVIYSQALDSIAVKLSDNEDLIKEISLLVSEEAIKQAIQKEAAELITRIEAAEAIVKTLSDGNAKLQSDVLDALTKTNEIDTEFENVKNLIGLDIKRTAVFYINKIRKTDHDVTIFIPYTCKISKMYVNMPKTSTSILTIALKKEEEVLSVIQLQPGEKYAEILIDKPIDYDALTIVANGDMFLPCISVCIDLVPII